MNRGARRDPIFFDHECCALFHRLLGQLPERFDIRIHAYALMPNHFHLLVQTPRANLSRAMHYLCGGYARQLNHTHEWDGPLFKGRFKNKVVEEEMYWKHLLAYVHLNPVRGGLVPRIDQSDWTSHSAYVGLDHTPDWLYLDEMLEIYGTPDAYFEYLTEVQYGRCEAPDGFERSVLWKKRAPNRPKEESPSPGADTAEGAFESAMGTLAGVTGLSQDQLLSAPRGRRGNRARWVVAWWLRWKDRMTGGAVSRFLGVSEARVSHMVRKAREAEEQDTEPLVTWMEQLRRIG
jgi:REP element-mobilizing transposase RayT